MSPSNRPSAVVSITTTVNGHQVSAEVPARMLLADFLRCELRLTGTHVGCEQGVCGACTVIVDGKPVRSCIQLAAQADGTDITTVEGLSSDGLSPMQAAFKENFALQCGFCTAGFLTTLASVDPAEYRSEEKMLELLSGNLCRCTGYEGIRRAVAAVWGQP